MLSDESNKFFVTELSQKDLKLRIYPDEILRQTTDKIIIFDKPLRDFADNMFTFMFKNKGIGLAAPQVGILYRIVTVGIKEAEWCLVNPKIVSMSSNKDKKTEGCLSLPDMNYDIKRNFKIEVRARNINGKKLHFEATGFHARVIQHEIDHLNGILICDKGEIASI